MRATRARIVGAALALHEEIGPAASSISAVASRAGVQRQTLYRYFADLPALVAACRTEYFAAHPPPDVGRWGRIADPRRRLSRGLGELYAYYGRAEPMLRNLSRDAAVNPDLYGRGLAALIQRAEAAFGEGLGLDRRRRALVALAVRFDTWRLLVRDRRLTAIEAATLIAGLVMRAGQR